MQKTGLENARRHLRLLGLSADGLKHGDSLRSACCVRDAATGQRHTWEPPYGMAALAPCSLTSRPAARPGWVDLRTSAGEGSHPRSTSRGLSQPPCRAQEAGVSPTERRGEGRSGLGRGSRPSGERQSHGLLPTPGCSLACGDLQCAHAVVSPLHLQSSLRPSGPLFCLASLKPGFSNHSTLDT